MAEQFTPHIGLSYGWSIGETPWSVDNAMKLLDVLVQPKVINTTTTAPPGSPTNGDTYIIAATATGVWAGKETQFAARIAGAWFYVTPTAGVRVWNIATSSFYYFDGTVWGVEVATSSRGANPMTTPGDLITGGVAGAEGRLAIGTTGQVLKVVGGVPAWDGSAGGGGAYEDFDEGAAPATPASNKVRVYAKADGRMYLKDDGGTEVGMSGAETGANSDITSMDALTGALQYASRVDFTEGSAPSTPSANKVSLYAKSDGKVYIKDDAGTETDLTATSAGSAGGDLSGTYPNPTLNPDASALSPAFTALTDGATITWALASDRISNAKVTLGGNRTLAITGAVDGATGVLKVTQDGTGSRTLALPSGSKVINTGAGAVTLSTGANKIDILTFIYDGTNYFWTIGKDYS